MGDRVIYNLKQKDGKYVSLYSHWGGYDSLKDLTKALKAAEPRWNDETYCSRIIVSQIVADNWKDVLGFGLWAADEPATYEDKWITVDLVTRTIEGNYEWNNGISATFEHLIESVA